ncbi:MAG: hypothetical protein EOP54_11495 [Sphingobacteriales bacterium]|nr:MAG: hypothetical protein EOP54_11495 [Sphingobacteriales bacterium]
MKNLIVTGLLSAVAATSFAQSKTDVKAIDALCGCFEVTFNYAETFTNDTQNEYKAGKLNDKAVVELSMPIEKTDKKVVIQHILVAGGHVIKHWREDWTYENANLWTFDGDQTWKKVPAAKPEQVKGTWTQTVWEVDDAPRYQGTSRWVENNNSLYWLNTTDAPLPRREYTKRDDYNVMERTNRLTINGNGYMHEQDNRKLIRKGGKDEVLAYEKGYNNYVKVADSKCDAATKFWTAEKAAFWKDVVAVWDNKMAKASTLTLTKDIDGKLMYEALDEIEKKNLTGAARQKAIEALMVKYIAVK